MTRTMIMLAVALGGACLSATTVDAQALLADEFRAAINRDGGDCQLVTHTQGVAMIADGTILMGAICSNGDRWLLVAIPATEQITRVFTCAGAIAVGMNLPFCEK